MRILCEADACRRRTQSREAVFNVALWKRPARDVGFSLWKRPARDVGLSLWKGTASISAPVQVPVRAPTLSSADLKLQASSAGRFYGARALGRRWDSAALESCDGVERHADRPRAGGEVD